MLGKTFRVTERYSIEFRAEAFNVTNTPPFNDPNGSFWFTCVWNYHKRREPTGLRVCC